MKQFLTLISIVFLQQSFEAKPLTHALRWTIPSANVGRLPVVKIEIIVYCMKMFATDIIINQKSDNWSKLFCLKMTVKWTIRTTSIYLLLCLVIFTLFMLYRWILFFRLPMLNKQKKLGLIMFFITFLVVNVISNEIHYINISHDFQFKVSSKLQYYI